MSYRYKLAEGTQVRREDFGLLFYTRSGPRLYFLSSGDLLNSSFFNSDLTLSQWLAKKSDNPEKAARHRPALENALSGLSQKGVILEH